jgi:AcrR family transcriptional regulator
LPRLHYTERAPRLANVADRPLRADAQRNREKVLRAAQDAFAASGYGVPLDEIAALAGVGPGTVYRHFPSKEDLFAAVVAAWLVELIADLRTRADDPDAGGAFFGFVSKLGMDAAEKPGMPDAITIPGELQADLYAAIAEVLRRAQEAGAVRREITTPDLIALLMGLLRTVRDTPPGTAGRLFTVVADGLRPPGGSTAGEHAKII